MIRKRVEALGKELLKKLDEAAQLAKANAAPKSQLVHQKAEQSAITDHEELPVVARLVVEIRSDGTRTVARGAMEDVMSGEMAQVRAEGGSPMQLAGSLAKSMLSVPALALQAARTVAEAKKNLKGKSDK
jgi:hypothetical protein